jgi:hypothetical protein
MTESQARGRCLIAACREVAPRPRVSVLADTSIWVEYLRGQEPGRLGAPIARPQADVRSRRRRKDEQESGRREPRPDTGVVGAGQVTRPHGGGAFSASATTRAS